MLLAAYSADWVLMACCMWQLPHAAVQDLYLQLCMQAMADQGFYLRPNGSARRPLVSWLLLHVQAMADQGSGGAYEISQRMTVRHCCSDTSHHG